MVLRTCYLMLAAVFACVAVADSAEARKWRKKRWSTKPVIVKTDLGLPTGSVVIVNNERKLYYVLGPGRSKRYRVAVGEKAEVWTGRTFVSEKRVDPDWNPVDGSQPFKGGQPGNPLGVRALYLDWSLLRIHGTATPGSIGGAVSNGCIRMYNRDVIDLYARVHIGAPVIAVNSRREVYRFRDHAFTGKLPAWSGQAEFWKARAQAERRGEKLSLKRYAALKESGRLPTDRRTRRRRYQRR